MTLFGSCSFQSSFWVAGVGRLQLLAAHCRSKACLQPRTFASMERAHWDKQSNPTQQSNHDARCDGRNSTRRDTHRSNDAGGGIRPVWRHRGAPYGRPPRSSTSSRPANDRGTRIKCESDRLPNSARRDEVLIPFGFPRVPGYDVAGIVAESDSDSAFAVGDRVMAFLDSTRGGVLANYGVCSDSVAARIPDSMSMQDAAAIPLAGTTALQSLRDHGKIK
jgi:hypothetical protein